MMNNLNNDESYDKIIERKKILEALTENKFSAEQIDSILARIDALFSMAECSDVRGLSDEIIIEIETLKSELPPDDRFSFRESNQYQAQTVKVHHKMTRAICAVIEKRRKTPYSKINKLVFLSRKYMEVYNRLLDIIVGQDHAVNEIVQTSFNAEICSKKNKPLACFLFAGPPGVGKTFLAESFAKLVGRPYKRFDMATYATDKAELGLIGDEPMYKSAEEGLLVEFVEDNPDAILLFDEIEKASPDVQRLFLSVIDGGKLENKYLASNTDFSDTILIFTTNAGKSIYKDPKYNAASVSADLMINEFVNEKEVSGNRFSPELCSRFAGEHIILFNHLKVPDLAKLLAKNMENECGLISGDLGLKIEFDKRLPLLILMHAGQVDARIATSKSLQFIRHELYEFALQLAKYKKIPALKKIRIDIDDDRLSPGLKDFFSPSDTDTKNVIVACDAERLEAVNKQIGSFAHIIYVDSPDDLMELDLSDVTMSLIDPFFGKEECGDRIMGIDDLNSAGMNIMTALLKSNAVSKNYLLEFNKRLSGTDINTVLIRGVSGCINASNKGFSDMVRDVIADSVLQAKCDDMINHRKRIVFETLQENADENGTAYIKLYNITFTDKINPEDRDLLVEIEDRPSVRFDDVIGAENAKDELRDFISYINNPAEYLKKSMGVPKGVLLYGPPGTGKTMLARAFAGECSATFIHTPASNLFAQGSYSVEKLFATARKYAPSIVFIDEVDAVARKRTGAQGSEFTTLNSLLTQMDGFDRNVDKPVFVIAATNFGVNSFNGTPGTIDGALDPAFIRRFGSKILVDLPNKNERKEYLFTRLSGSGKKTLRNTVTEKTMENVADRTPGLSLSDLENVLAFAFRNARRKSSILTDDILVESLEEYLFGEEKKADEKKIYQTAFHEASHAYVYSLSGHAPSYLTVVARGEFGGYMHPGSDDSGTHTKEELLWMIRTALAGRAGEIVKFGKEAGVNTGASADLRRATSVALSMISFYGMGEQLVFTGFSGSGNPPKAVMDEADRLLKEQEQICIELITSGLSRVEALADELARQGHLDKADIEAVLKQDV